MERGIKLPQSPSEWGFKGENYLLMIGIDNYANWKPLHNAVKDVRDISKLLTERYQFEATHLISLIDDEATEDNIRQKLLEVKKNITPEDNLIVFFSGHGHYDEDLDEGYWVPSNARKDHPSDYISNSDVLKWIRAIKTHHTLVIVDSCFSGTLVSQSRSEVLSEKYPSCRIFASGRKELVDDGVPGENSPFAKAILSRLSRNSDRVMRASELIQNVTKSVESNGGQAPIEGRIKDSRDEGGEFVFHLKITEEEIWTAVVEANTVEEYLKYIDYYPDGTHVLQARTKISQLTDEDDWKRAIELSTSGALTQYLEAHPRGEHNDEALRRLEEIEENDGWQFAKTRNTVSAYMDYLRKYPSGKFETLARKNLDTLKQALKQHEQVEVQGELEGIADTTVNVTDNKEKYKNLINDAEGLYAQMAYAKSIEKYQQALRLHQKHYVPDLKFVEQRIASAKARIEYVEFLDDGKQAVTAGNYSLALEYFKKAKNIDDTAKIREWITHCELKLGMIEPAPSPVNSKSNVESGNFADRTFKNSDTEVVMVKKKSSGVSIFLWIAGIFVIVAIGVVYNIIKSNVDDYNSGYDYSSKPEDNANASRTEISSPVDEQSDGAVYTPQTNETNQSIGSLIPGSWNVADRVINGTSYAKMGSLLPASWVFDQNGSVTYWLSGNSETGSWHLSGNDLSVTLPSIGTITGFVSEVNNQSMIWVTTELILNNQFTVSNYLSRVN